MAEAHSCPPRVRGHGGREGSRPIGAMSRRGRRRTWGMAQVRIGGAGHEEMAFEDSGVPPSDPPRDPGRKGIT